MKNLPYGCKKSVLCAPGDKTTPWWQPFMFSFDYGNDFNANKSWFIFLSNQPTWDNCTWGKSKLWLRIKVLSQKQNLNVNILNPTWWENKKADIGWAFQITSLYTSCHNWPSQCLCWLSNSCQVNNATIDDAVCCSGQDLQHYPMTSIKI